MENGLYAAVKTNDTVHAVFIDQENLEFSQLNKMVKANRQKHLREQAEQREAAEKAWRAEMARKRKFWRFIRRNVGQELFLGAAMAVVYLGFTHGLVSAVFAFPVLAILLGLFSFKAGNFFTRIFRRRR